MQVEVIKIASFQKLLNTASLLSVYPSLLLSRLFIIDHKSLADQIRWEDQIAGLKCMGSLTAWFNDDILTVGPEVLIQLFIIGWWWWGLMGSKKRGTPGKVSPLSLSLSILSQ